MQKAIWSGGAGPDRNTGNEEDSQKSKRAKKLSGERSNPTIGKDGKGQNGKDQGIVLGEKGR